MNNLYWVVTYGLLTAGYLPLNHRRAKYFFETKWDKYIPTVPVFIVPYVVYYLLVVGAVWLMWGTPLFGWYIKSLVVTQLMASLFWFMVPNGVIKKKLPGKTVFERMINIIYSVDGGTNGFPSAHVFVSLIDGYFLSLAGFGWGLPLGVLIASSTVFVKQHYVVDVPAGVLWAVMGVIIGAYV